MTYYVIKLPNDTVVYGRMKKFLWFSWQEVIGNISGSDDVWNIQQAIAEIRLLHDSPVIHFYFNDKPPEDTYASW